MGWESSGVVGFDLGLLVQGQIRTAKLKSAYNSFIIDPRGFGALSLGWIQFASVFRCARSSFFLKGCVLFTETANLHFCEKDLSLSQKLQILTFLKRMHPFFSIK